MRTLAWVAATLTAAILIYTIRQPTLGYIFHHNEEVPTPHGWEPKMRTWINGEQQ